MKRKVMVLYSATGNSLYIARLFRDYEIVDALTCTSLPEDTDTLGFCFPVYHGGVPYPVERFIREVIAERDNTALGYIFAVMTYGGAKGFCYQHMADLLMEAGGCVLSYAASVEMPDAYIPLTKVAISSKERDETAKKALIAMEGIMEDIESEKYSFSHPGLLYRLSKKHMAKSRLPERNDSFSIADSCTGCGTCASVCPMANIRIENGRPVMGDMCLSCFACYHNCPEDAIRYPGAEGRYEPLCHKEE